MRSVIFVEVRIVAGGHVNAAVAEARALANRMRVTVRLYFAAAFGDIDPGDPRTNAEISAQILRMDERMQRAS